MKKIVFVFFVLIAFNLNAKISSLSEDKSALGNLGNLELNFGNKPGDICEGYNLTSCGIDEEPSDFCTRNPKYFKTCKKKEK